MLNTGSTAVRSGYPARAEVGEQGVNVPGLVAAVVWATGLLLGLVLLTTGHSVVAAAILVVAVMAPWIGLAVSRSRIPVSGSEISTR
ncbi:hypothetical protein B1987_12700 [Mycobacterium kansasii]|nr:hypothetical protein [Mycobacterium attenuatum]ORB87485.1 hypothetical protein B1987_12700 [Mycobacterium kansasii]